MKFWPVPQNPYANSWFALYAVLDSPPNQADTPIIRFYINTDERERVAVDYDQAFIWVLLPAGTYAFGAVLYHDDQPTGEGLAEYITVSNVPQSAPQTSPSAPTATPSPTPTAGHGAPPSTRGSHTGTAASQAETAPTPAPDSFTDQPTVDPFTGQPIADPFTTQALTPPTANYDVPQSVRDMIYGIYGQAPPGATPTLAAPAEPGISVEQWIGNWASDIVGGIGTAITQGIATAAQSVFDAAELTAEIGYTTTSTAIGSISEVLRPVIAGAQIIGGTTEVIGGTLFAAVTAETGAGVVAGAAVAAHGFDQLVAGARTLAGENAETLTYKATHDLTYALTDSEIAARATGLAVDTVAGFAGGAIASRGFGSLATPLLSANSALVGGDFTGAIDALGSSPEAMTATSANAARIEMVAAEAVEHSQLEGATATARVETTPPAQIEKAVPIPGPNLTAARPLPGEAILFSDAPPQVPLWERGDFVPRSEATAYITSGGGNQGLTSSTPTLSGNQLPEFVVDWANPNHRVLADNIWQAQAAGHQRELEYMGDRVAAALNRGDATAGIPNILSRDEYPFASTFQGGGNAWIGHIPASQNSAQGGMLSQFYRKHGPNGERFTFLVTVINHPRGPVP